LSYSILAASLKKCGLATTVVKAWNLLNAADYRRDIAEQIVPRGTFSTVRAVEIRSNAFGREKVRHRAFQKAPELEDVPKGPASEPRD